MADGSVKVSCFEAETRREDEARSPKPGHFEFLGDWGEGRVGAGSPVMKQHNLPSASAAHAEGTSDYRPPGHGLAGTRRPKRYKNVKRSQVEIEVRFVLLGKCVYLRPQSDAN